MEFDTPVASAARKYLRREKLIRTVVGHLRGGPLPADANTGRYAFIWEAIRTQLDVNPAEDDGALAPEQVHRAWRRTCEKYAEDPRFWHGVAVFEREWALEAEGRGDSETAVGHWARANGVFCHVLCCPDVWARVEDGSEDLDAGQVRKVQKDVIGRIIDGHIDRARQVWHSDADTARVHGVCLQRLVRLSLSEPIDGIGVTPSLPVDDELQHFVREMAARAVERWTNDWIYRAEKMLENEEAISRQPAGIKRAYPDAIEHVMAFLDILPHNERAARYTVQQYNAYAKDALTVDREGLFERVMAQSRRAARYLEPVAVRGRGGQPGNVALCRRLTLCALTDCDAEGVVGYLIEALAWNPGDSNALRLLEEARDLPIQEELSTARERIEAGDYEQAEKILDDLAESLGEVIEPIRQVRGFSRYRQANAAAAARRFERAAELMREAAELVPAEDTVVRMSAVFDRMALEAEQYRAYYTASDELSEGNTLAAMQLTETIGPDFSEYAAVRRLRARICHAEALRLFDDHEEFRAARALMDAAVELDPDSVLLREERESLEELARSDVLARAMSGDASAALELIGSEATKMGQRCDEPAGDAGLEAGVEGGSAALDEAVEYLQGGEAGRALEVLDQAPAELRAKPEVKQVLWQACCGEGLRVAEEDGDLLGARELLERALRHVDDRHRPAVQKHLERIRRSMRQR